MTDITTVTFDLWQTLLLDNRAVGSARAMVRLEGTQQALDRFGEAYELEHIREAYRACYRHCRLIREEGLDISFQDQVEVFVNNISDGLVERLDPVTLQEIARVYADSFLVHPPKPHTQALAVLRDLKAMGLGIGLISNTGMTPGALFRTFLEQHGLLSYFDTLTFSDEVKLAKPNREIFMLTLRAMGASPSESIHVGDHVTNDVVGANMLGMKTVWITGFYERDDPEDPKSDPDATVDDLGLVSSAVAQLSGRQLPG
ncbi:MAG: hypothetical protein BZY81_08400 [SAR202 cluster bacterium Io17-Chloro-G4]|nr:MAG: hypothetical protein BZY81_08400 [SAR202 cluster bacterium Io17-Chloro-G4]